MREIGRGGREGSAVKEGLQRTDSKQYAGRDSRLCGGENVPNVEPMAWRRPPPQSFVQPSMTSDLSKHSTKAFLGK